MRKNRANSGYLFLRKNTRIFTTIEYILRNYWKILKRLSQFWRNLLKMSEEILRCEEFYCYKISIKFWISFDKGKWNLNKGVHKNFIRIIKIFWENMRRFWAYFAEINFRMGKIMRRLYFAKINFRVGKIMRKFKENVKEILGRIRKILD